MKTDASDNIASKPVTVAVNSPRAWLQAARPKTLAGAVAPVVVALAAAWMDAEAYAGGRALHFSSLPAVLCMVFALLMQVDANFINDYFDFVRGRDDNATRLGPERACAQGWVTQRAMAGAITATTVVASLVGLPLVLWGGTEMLLVGALCVVFCFLYTTSLAQRGWGDVLVLVFFGLVPVCVTYYIQLHAVTPHVVALSIGMGLATDCLLVVNNYRDRHQDAAVGKRTLIVRLGSKGGEWLYLCLGIVAVMLPLLARCLAATITWQFDAHWPSAWALLPLLYLLPHTLVWRQMVNIHEGRALNGVLGRTSACILLYAILQAVSILLS